MHSPPHTLTLTALRKSSPVLYYQARRLLSILNHSESLGLGEPGVTLRAQSTVLRGSCWYDWSPILPSLKGSVSSSKWGPCHRLSFLLSSSTVLQLGSREPVGPGWDIGQVNKSHSRGSEAREQGQHRAWYCVLQKRYCFGG